MKRLLLCWVDGTRKVKLSASQKLIVNTRRETFRCVVTSDFNRKPRTLAELAHWKATEFRTFLLYTGFFVSHRIDHDDILSHFLSLSVSLRILISDKLAVDKELRTFAHELLCYFVNKSAEIYGPQFLVYNVHSLTRLSKEVELFGKLDNCSAFEFENYMQTLKKYARSAKNPVLQVSRRLQEFSSFNNVLPLSAVAAHLELQNFTCTPPNNCCILYSDHRCCQIISKSPTSAVCVVFNKSEPVYVSPIDSRTVGIHKVRIPSGIVKHLPLNTLACKAMCYADFSSDYLVFTELLHGMHGV
jgi:hypothetical protein